MSKHDLNCVQKGKQRDFIQKQILYENKNMLLSTCDATKTIILNGKSVLLVETHMYVDQARTLPFLYIYNKSIHSFESIYNILCYPSHNSVI